MTKPTDKDLDAIADQLVQMSKRVFELETNDRRNTLTIDDLRKRVATLENQAWIGSMP